METRSRRVSGDINDPGGKAPSLWASRLSIADVAGGSGPDREQRGSAVLGRTKQLLVIWHALAEHQAADIARLIEVDP
ncbi:MAG: hypothetical protein WAN75_51325 [Xanthobacteraceae bacterium]